MNEIINAGNTLQVVNKPATIAEMLLEFADYIQVKDITAKGYGVCLRCFMQWLSDNGITKPERNDIKNYVKWLESPHEKRTHVPDGQKPTVITFSAGTQATYLRAVKLFFEWTEHEEYYPNIAKKIKGAAVDNSVHKRDDFNESELLTILNSIDRSTIDGKRDYAMLCLCGLRGLRTIELHRANIGNIEIISGKPVLYVHGKGHNEADTKVDLDTVTYEAIQDYIAAKGKCNADEALFTGTGNRNNGRIEESTISKIIKQRLVAAGFNSRRHTAHSLRHAAITNFIMSGASLREAQLFARHKSPETTCIYLHDIERTTQNYAQRLSDHIFKPDKTPKSRILTAAENATNLSYNSQELLAEEIEKLVEKYRNIEKGVN